MIIYTTLEGIELLKVKANPCFNFYIYEGNSNINKVGKLRVNKIPYIQETSLTLCFKYYELLDIIRFTAFNHEPILNPMELTDWFEEQEQLQLLYKLQEIT